MFGKDWTSEYYDVMEFYYWEPQHLGKIKNPKNRYNTADKALRHIQNMEVSLNHMFNVFFRLAPSSFINQITNTFDKTKTYEKFTSQGRYSVSEYSSMVQPDLLFTSDKTNFSIEMKIGAKSSLEQIYKYALLHYLEQQHSQIPKESLLLYMGKNDFKDLWKEEFTSVDTLKAMAISSNIDNLKMKALRNEKVVIDWNEVHNVLEKTQIAYCSYAKFAKLLKSYLKNISKDDEASETIVKLFNGLYAELERRELI